MSFDLEAARERAENERFDGVSPSLLLAACDEIEELTKSLDYYINRNHEHFDKWEAAEAEIERLREAYQEHARDWDAERNRLREALREIAEGPRDVVADASDGQPVIVSGDDSFGYSECLRIARAALEEKP